MTSNRIIHQKWNVPLPVAEFRPPFSFSVLNFFCAHDAWRTKTCEWLTWLGLVPPQNDKAFVFFVYVGFFSIFLFFRWSLFTCIFFNTPSPQSEPVIAMGRCTGRSFCTVCLSLHAQRLSRWRSTVAVCFPFHRPYSRLQNLARILLSTFVDCLLCLHSVFHMRRMSRQRKSNVP